MTTAVSNTKINNLEEMLSTVQKTVDKTNANINKATSNFENIYDKSINKAKQKIDTQNADNKTYTNSTTKNSSNTDLKYKKETEEKNTLSIDKDSSSKESKTEETNSWADFKNILSEIREEVNAETSLDLTLSKDINEIISQLKDAIENTNELIEEDMNVSISIPLADELVNIEEDVTAEEDVVAEDDVAAEEETENVQIPTEQLFSFYEKSLIKVENTLESSSNSIKDTTFIEDNIVEQSEIIEFSENLTDEIASSNSKTNEENSSQDLESLLDEDMLKELNIESLTADTETSNGNETFMHRQAPEEVAIKTMINKETDVFEIKVEQTQNIQTQQQIQVKPTEINPSRILEQITKQLDGLMNNSKVNIVLNPESLGKVSVQLFQTKEGLMAQLTVTTQEAKDILMKGLDGLKDSLLSHGVSTDNVSVKIADAQKSEYEADWTEQEGSNGGNKGNKNPNREEKEKGLFEKMMAQTLDEENGNV